MITCCCFSSAPVLFSQRTKCAIVLVPDGKGNENCSFVERPSEVGMKVEKALLTCFSRRYRTKRLYDCDHMLLPFHCLLQAQSGQSFSTMTARETRTSAFVGLEIGKGIAGMVAKNKGLKGIQACDHMLFCSPIFFRCRHKVGNRPRPRWQGQRAPRLRFGVSQVLRPLPTPSDVHPAHREPPGKLL